MKPDSTFKVITVILDKDGTATELARKLKEEHKLFTGNIQNARGTGDPSTKRSFMSQVEKDLLTVMVPEEQADDIFTFIYQECRMGDLFGGFMYQAHLGRTSEYSLPDLGEE